MKRCCVIGALFLVAGFSYSKGMTIHLLDIAAQQSSIEDGSLLTRIFFSKNITGRIGYTTELDGASEKNAVRFHNDFSGRDNSNHTNDESELGQVFDSWSIVWYIASFSGLILFFLIVSCSEWCCRSRIRQQQLQQQQDARTQSTPSQTDRRVIATRSQPEQQPPPSYDQFAPPSYDSLLDTLANADTKKSEYEVYVVPVHTMTTIMSAVAATPTTTDGVSTVLPQEVLPPSYAVLNMHTTAAAPPIGQGPRC